MSEKLSIAKAKLALRVGVDVQTFAGPEEHLCELCSYKMSASDLKSVDSLPSLESTLTFDEVQALSPGGCAMSPGKITLELTVLTHFFITKNVVSLPNI